MQRTILCCALWATVAALWLALKPDGSASELGYRMMVPEYTAQYRQEADPVQRAALVDALGQRSAVVYRPLLSLAARDPDQRVRACAARRLARE